MTGAAQASGAELFFDRRDLIRIERKISLDNLCRIAFVLLDVCDVILEVSARVVLGQIKLCMLRDDWIEFIQRFQDRCFASFVFSDETGDIRNIELVRVHDGFELVNMDLRELHSAPYRSRLRKRNCGVVTWFGQYKKLYISPPLRPRRRGK